METPSTFRHPSRRGFTFVELRVVVATALRQVGMAQVSYAAEDNGAINTLRDTGEDLHEGS